MENHPAYQGLMLMQAIDKLDELIAYSRDKEAYFADLKNRGDLDYDYSEGAEEAYGHLNKVCLRMKGELLNGIRTK